MLDDCNAALEFALSDVEETDRKNGALDDCRVQFLLLHATSPVEVPAKVSEVDEKGVLDKDAKFMIVKQWSKLRKWSKEFCLQVHKQAERKDDPDTPNAQEADADKEDGVDENANNIGGHEAADDETSRCDSSSLESALVAALGGGMDPTGASTLAAEMASPKCSSTALSMISALQTSMTSVSKVIDAESSKFWETLARLSRTMTPLHHCKKLFWETNADFFKEGKGLHMNEWATRVVSGCMLSTVLGFSGLHSFGVRPTHPAHPQQTQQTRSSSLGPHAQPKSNLVPGHPRLFPSSPPHFHRRLVRRFIYSSCQFRFDVRFVVILLRGLATVIPASLDAFAKGDSFQVWRVARLMHSLISAAEGGSDFNNILGADLVLLPFKKLFKDQAGLERFLACRGLLTLSMLGGMQSWVAEAVNDVEEESDRFSLLQHVHGQLDAAMKYSRYWC